MEIPKIHESEYRFCLIMWEHEPVTAVELVKLCQDQLGWKRTTTYTVIKRLGERGVLKNENGTVTSLVSKDEAQACEIDELVEKKFESSLPAFIAAFTTVFDFSFAGNTSGGQIMELTEDKHYWCIAVVNEGTSGITIDVAGVIYKVEAGATGYIYPDEAWAPGTYSVSFGCTSGSGMKGYAICNISSVPIIEKEPLAVRLTE